MSQSPLHIENSLVTADYDRELDLQSLAEDIGPAATYDATSYHALTYAPSTVDGTANVFRTGSCVITGVTEIAQARTLIEKLHDSLSGSLPTPSFSLTNLVVSADLGRPLSLTRAVLALGLENAEYEPELFPALVYQTPRTEATILLYSSGQLIITGVVSKTAANTAYTHLTTTLQRVGLLAEESIAHPSD